MGRLKLLFPGILVVMLAVTTWASLDHSVFQAGNLLDDPWAWRRWSTPTWGS
jgi:hypothetical protein